MLPFVFTMLILYSCFLNNGSCDFYDELKELKTEFDINLYQQLAEPENRTNLIVAPASVSISLRLLQFGAQGNTFTQLEDALGYNIHGGEADCIYLDTVSSPLNQMAVVSTMYFKSIWQKKFSFTDTQSLPFTTAEGITLKVPTMYHTAEVNYGQFHTLSLEQFSVVELPYLGETVSMFVVLPSDRTTSLSQIESHLSAKTITLWANSLKRMKMDIFLPRFRIQSHFDLKMVLPVLGITDMFDPAKADFKGISEQGNLYISEAIHKAKIEVTEEGTKASGTTAMVLLKDLELLFSK